MIEFYSALMLARHVSELTVLLDTSSYYKVTAGHVK